MDAVPYSVFGRNDPEGRPLSYKVMLDREGRHLRPSETVGEALRTGDHVVLHPKVKAGGNR